MQKIAMITGGTGAGKTAHALKLASEYSRKVYIATAEITDQEMQKKVDAHIAERDHSYKTIEEPTEISDALIKASDADVIIIDCITFWVNNLLYYNKDIPEQFNRLLDSLKNIKKPVIIVTNEIGLGIIPADRETRLYAKNLSRINRQIADTADRVTMMVSGLQLQIK